MVEKMGAGCLAKWWAVWFHSWCGPCVAGKWCCRRRLSLLLKIFIAYFLWYWPVMWYISRCWHLSWIWCFPVVLKCGEVLDLCWCWLSLIRFICRGSGVRCTCRGSDLRCGWPLRLIIICCGTGSGLRYSWAWLFRIICWGSGLPALQLTFTIRDDMLW